MDTKNGIDSFDVQPSKLKPPPNLDLEPFNIFDRK